MVLDSILIALVSILIVLASQHFDISPCILWLELSECWLSECWLELLEENARYYYQNDCPSFLVASMTLSEDIIRLLIVSLKLHCAMMLSQHLKFLLQSKKAMSDKKKLIFSFNTSWRLCTHKKNSIPIKPMSATLYIPLKGSIMLRLRPLPIF